jgi:oxygen-independent coproporphyrinogen-3 oxidase
VRQEFGSEILEKIEKNLGPFLEQNLLSLENNFCKTTKVGKLMADKIASDLFILENDH